MSVQSQDKLLFQGVSFPVVHFDAQKKYDGASKIDLQVTPKVFYPKEDLTSFTIVMEVRLYCKDVFSLEILASGMFKYGNESIEEQLKASFINVNAPAIMFPYVRSFISTLTSNVGNTIGALTIPTQFFNGTLEEYIPKKTTED